MEHMVEVRSVRKQFGNFVAVDGVDLNVRAGEFLTLLGPSGCGKTTLLRMISGFETPTQGSIFLAGRDVTRLPPYRRDVNQVFQSYALFPHLNVWKNVAFGLRMKRVPSATIKQRVEQAIGLVSLAGFEHRKPSELSGGQKQRVALARALVCEPKVLLLDEPLAALDAKLRRAMQVELKRLQSRLGITFIFVTHDQDEALVMSDRIAVVNAGKIEQIGTVSEVYRQPNTRFVADFLGAANVLSVQVLSDNGMTARLGCDDSLVLSAPSGQLEAGSSATICIRPEKIRVSRSCPSNDCAFEATVGECLFRGSNHQVQLTTTGSQSLVATVPCQGENDRPFTAGEKVFCQIEDDDVIVLDSTKPRSIEAPSSPSSQERQEAQ